MQLGGSISKFVVFNIVIFRYLNYKHIDEQNTITMLHRNIFCFIVSMNGFPKEIRQRIFFGDNAQLVELRRMILQNLNEKAAFEHNQNNYVPP